MNTAQLTQTPGRFIDGIVARPNSANNNQPVPDSLKPELTNDLPVATQDESAHAFHNQNPISASVPHIMQAPEAPVDKILSAASQAVSKEHDVALNMKRPRNAPPSSMPATPPKPIAETVILVVACLMVCAAALIFFGQNN